MNQRNIFAYERDFKLNEQKRTFQYTSLKCFPQKTKSNKKNSTTYENLIDIFLLPCIVTEIFHLYMEDFPNRK